MPTRLTARYEMARTDPELLSIHNDVAFISTLLSEKVAQYGAADGEVDWTDAIERIERINKNWMTWDRTRIEKELKELAEIAGNRASQARLVHEIRNLIRERVALVQAENKRLREMKQTLSVEQVIVIAQTLVDIVRRHVGEDERGTSTLRKVHADVRTVLNFSDARRKKGDE